MKLFDKELEVVTKETVLPLLLFFHWLFLFSWYKGLVGAQVEAVVSGQHV